MANLHCHCRLDLFWFFRGPFVWPLSQEHLQYNTEISTVKGGSAKVHKVYEVCSQNIRKVASKDSKQGADRGASTKNGPAGCPAGPE